MDILAKNEFIRVKLLFTLIWENRFLVVMNVLTCSSMKGKVGKK